MFQFLHNVSFDVDQTSSNYDIQFPVITMNIHLTRQVFTYHTQHPTSPPWRPTATGWLPCLSHLLPLHGLRQPRLALPLHLCWVGSWQSFHGNDNVTHSDCHVWKRQAKRAKVRSKTRACNRTIIVHYICQHETIQIWCWLWPGCLTWPASTSGWWRASSWSFSASLSLSLHPVWAKQAWRWSLVTDQPSLVQYFVFQLSKRANTLFCSSTVRCWSFTASSLFLYFSSPSMPYIGHSWSLDLQFLLTCDQNFMK